MKSIFAFGVICVLALTQTPVLGDSGWVTPDWNSFEMDPKGTLEIARCIAASLYSVNGNREAKLAFAELEKNVR